jgi:hypothetical protein
MLYSKWSWKVLWIIAVYGKGAIWRSDELVKEYSEAQEGSPVTYYYSARGVRDVMKEYNVVKQWKDHIFPYRIDKYVNYEYEWVWYFRMLPTSWFRWLERRFGWHTMIVAKPRPTQGATR